MSSSIRVLHVLDHSLPLLSGYSTRSHHILRAQRAAGIDACAVTSPKHGSATQEERIDGITYLRTPARPEGRGAAVPVAAELRLMQRLAASVSRVARQSGCHVIHAHSPVLNGLPAYWVARRLGLPVVYEIRAFWEDAAVDHGTHKENSPRYRLIRSLETWLARRVDAVGAISKGLADELLQRGIAPGRLFTIPNGVDVQRFQPQPPDPELSTRWGLSGRFVVGFIGSFYRYEGLDLLLDAWARVAADLPEARLLLVGGGEVGDELRAKAKRLGVEGRTIFAGSVPHAEASRCYSVCDLLVYPRRAMRLTELVTPLKPLEAMAAGKAVLASDIGGMRELIRDGETGVLFRPEDPAALALQLRDLARDEDRRATLGRCARQSVCTERQWTHLIQVHARTYRSLLANANAAT